MVGAEGVGTDVRCDPRGGNLCGIAGHGWVVPFRENRIIYVCENGGRVVDCQEVRGRRLLMRHGARSVRKATHERAEVARIAGLFRATLFSEL